MNPPFKRSVSGFSLTEMLIVVAVIGLLAGIAMPSYNGYIRDSRLRDGTALLAEFRVRLEQQFQDNRIYGPVSGNCAPALPISEAFTYACTVGASADTYTATATSKAGQGLGNAGNYVYSITQTNVRSTTQFNGSTVTKSCWLVKGGEC